MVEPIDNRREGFRFRAVMGLPALAAVAHKACEFELAQMFGDRGLGDVELLGQHPDGLLAAPCEALENRAARGIAEGFEQEVGRGVHG